MDEAFAKVRASFDRFCLAAGIEALGTMTEADVTPACERVRVVDGREVTIPSWENGGAGALARWLGGELDADQRIDAPVRPRYPAARG